MADISVSDLQNILIRCASRTFLVELIANTPTGETGNVASAWDIEMDGLDIVLYNEEFGNIVLYLEEGTSPYDIYPKRGKALAFKWGGAPSIKGQPAGKGGEYLFRKVHHPGIEARLFVQKTLTDKGTQKKFIKLLDQELEKLVLKKYKTFSK
jgi:hypothetical protein